MPQQLPAVRFTALYEAHRAAGASFTDFGGWQMPLKYSSELKEHHTVRTAAGLFDLSHMGEIWVTGPDAAAFLDFALVSNLSAIAVGKAKYSLLCTPDGGIIDDLITYRLTPGSPQSDTFLVVPNAGNAAAVAAELLARATSFDALVEDASAATSLIAVQGPTAQAILSTLVPEHQRAVLTEMSYYSIARVTIAGNEVLLARTGYTGEDGFEIYIENSLAASLWQRVLDAGEPFGLSPCGLACRDSLRLEAGMPLYGNELSLGGNPFSAGLGGVVALRKESDFVGRAALESLKAAGVGTTTGRRLVGLKAVGPRAGRSHSAVLSDGIVIGEITSGQPSPTLRYPIALAYVDVDFAAIGTRVDVDLRGRSEPFDVVALPFYTRER